MTEFLRWTAALVLLLLTIHCESKPLKSTTNVSANEANTTPCPDELIGEKEEKNIVKTSQKPINVHSDTEDTTTPCPEESENNEKLINLEEALMELTKTDDQSESSEENSESTTTICPEELEKQKLELPSKNIVKFTEETTDETTICPEELKKRKLGTSESESDHELEEEIENATNINGNHIKQSDAFLASSLQNSLKTPSIEKEDATEDRFEIEPATEKLVQKAESPETAEKLTRKQEEHKDHDISVKTLLDVQKDSALLKLVKDKFDPISGKFLKVEPVSSDKARSKRQTGNYSPYYSRQPSYNPEGVAADPNQNTLKSSQPVSYPNYQVPNQQSNTQNNVRTYQQIQKQYQGFYPNQSYQNYGKPLKGYQNIRRYPSVNKNYYKGKSASNRRQYQANARLSSTTSIPIRPNIQKKFRPSPVFP